MNFKQLFKFITFPKQRSISSIKDKNTSPTLQTQHSKLQALNKFFTAWRQNKFFIAHSLFYIFILYSIKLLPYVCVCICVICDNVNASWWIMIMLTSIDFSFRWKKSEKRRRENKTKIKKFLKWKIEKFSLSIFLHKRVHMWKRYE